MAESIIVDAKLFGCSMILGFFFTCLYDQFLLRRKIFCVNTLWDVCEDIIFSIFVFFICFFGVTYGNNGIIRLYMLLAIAIGCLLYVATIGRVYKRLMCHIFDVVMLPVKVLKKRLTILSLHLTMKVRERIKKGDRDAKTKKKKQTKVSSDEK